MFVFNHIPRTGGTFLLTKLRATERYGGPEVSFGPPVAPRVCFSRSYRPEMLVYHCGGLAFSQRYRRQPGEFTFTLLRDRVDMTYSNFAYMKNRISRGDRIPHWTEAQHRYYDRSIEAHVDWLLSQPPGDQEYPESLDCYDFVGVAEEMDQTLARLRSVLGVSLPNDGLINHVPVAKTYRRDELCERFARQRRLHEAARQQLFS